ADPGLDGTLIQFVSYLKKRNSPPVDINLTVDGKSRIVTKVVDGWVTGIHGDFGTPEDLATPGSCTDEADNDFDAKIDAADEGCQAQCRDYAFYFGPAPMITPLAVGDGPAFVVSMQNRDAALGFQLGVKAASAGGTTTWEFSGSLGADANRLVELIITDDRGDSRTPEAGNSATTSSGATVEGMERGAAIAGFSGDDFLEFDLAPGAGGPGFTVGYVADLTPAAGGGNEIPPTGTDTCPVNEILRVNLGGERARFRRGDASGDTRINVTDAVFIIQNIVGNIAKRYACDDILDANDDGILTFLDALPVLSYMFQQGPELPAPFKTCGTDPTADQLPCTQSSC
ncbi:MAG TPA: hypothetical protein VMT52_12655, partial [Planctomycetota bacterium]|nr:hypothetical protein [Planctomycetota bacterium]